MAPKYTPEIELSCQPSHSGEAIQTKCQKPIDSSAKSHESGSLSRFPKDNDFRRVSVIEPPPAIRGSRRAPPIKWLRHRIKAFRGRAGSLCSAGRRRGGKAAVRLNATLDWSCAGYRRIITKREKFTTATYVRKRNYGRSGARRTSGSVPER